jgi:Flp pilus assembly protein TadG
MFKRERGQTLLEFALVLPAILLLFFILIESGRLFHAYVTVQHAAREGARYAVTGQHDEAIGDRVTTIKHTARMAASSLVVDPNKVDLVNGPASPYYDDASALIVRVWGPRGEDDAGGPGERVTVRVVYNLPILTPVLSSIAPMVPLAGQIEMINEGFGATGASHGGQLPPPLPALPTEGPTPTPSNTPTNTPVPTPTFIQLYIDPVYVGDNTITGGGQQGQLVTIRDPQAREVLGTVTINELGKFEFDFVVDVSRLGHLIVATAYSQVASTEVLGGTPTPTPTNTPTGTATNTPTATSTPSEQFVALSSSCGDALSQVTVTGQNWGNNQDSIVVWSADANCDAGDTLFNPPGLFNSGNSGTWSHDVTMPQGVSTLYVCGAWRQNSNKPWEYTAPVQFDIPCRTPTPTASPTPRAPDLVIEGLSLRDQMTDTVEVGQALTFDVVVANRGGGAVNSLFWNDLFVDPQANPPITAQGLFDFDIGTERNVDWGGISSLAAGSALTIPLSYPEGFSIPGEHAVYVSTDSMLEVDEVSEENNVNAEPLVVVVSGSTPTPSPTPETGDGSISGATWVWVGGNWTVPQGRVVVTCYDSDGNWVATTQSKDGYYTLENLPSGTYRVVGSIVIDGVTYYDEYTDVTVTSPSNTPFIDLFLMPL